MSNLRVVLKTETEEKAYEIAEEILQDAASFGMIHLEDIDILPTDDGQWEASFYVHNWEIFRKIADKSKEKLGQAAGYAKTYPSVEMIGSGAKKAFEVGKGKTGQAYGYASTEGLKNVKGGFSKAKEGVSGAASFVSEKTPERVKGVASGISTIAGEKALQYGVSGVGLTGSQKLAYEFKRSDLLLRQAQEGQRKASERFEKRTTDVESKYGSMENAFRTEYNKIIRALRDSETSEVDMQILREFVNQAENYGIDVTLIDAMAKFRKQLSGQSSLVSAGAKTLGSIAKSGSASSVNIASAISRTVAPTARQEIPRGGIGGINPGGQPKGIGGVVRGFDSSPNPRGMFNIPDNMRVNRRI